MCVGSLKVYDCTGGDGVHHATRYVQQADVCSKGPCFEVSDSFKNVRVRGKCPDCEATPSITSDTSERNRLETTGLIDLVRALNALQHPAASEASTGRASMLHALKRLRLDETHVAESTEASSFVDRSPQDFAAAQAHLESRMGVPGQASVGDTHQQSSAFAEAL